MASEYVANFGVDDNGDHIPDEYQIEVTYSAVNGSVDLTEKQYVTLYKDNHYATKEEGGVGTLADDQIAKATAANGYSQASESWNPEKPEAGITQFTEDTHYTISFAENAAVEIKYVPDDAEHGTTTNSPNMVNPATGTPAGSVATAKEGYAFKNWTKDGEVVSWNAELKPEDIAKVGGLYVASEYVANFGVDDNGDHIPDEYQTIFYYISADDAKGTVSIAEEVHTFRDDDGNYIEKTAISPDGAIAIAKDGNAFDYWSDGTIKDNTSNMLSLKGQTYLNDTTFTAYFDEDIKGGGENGNQSDEIPDKYQTIFHYESSDVSKGTVGPNAVEVHTFRDDNGNYIDKTPISPNGATATATDGNAFDYWTDNDTKDSTIDMSILKSKTYLEDTTFTAYFDTDEKGNGPDGNEPDGVPDKYETIFVYKSADVTKGTVDADPLKAEVHVFMDADGNYTEKTPISPNGSIATALDGYAFDYWTDREVNDYTPDMSKMKLNTYLVDTTFTAYFDVDEIGTEEPNTPDGVPDKYQIVFQYVSEDANRGTVSGTVTEVKTIYEIVTGEDGNDHRELRPARPGANVTVSSIGNYTFNNWTDGSRSYANADEIKAAEFTQSTTFTAQFRYSGGGGGGGGGGTGGNTEGNGRYTPSTGGPGATTTITPEDVPLAPLPESPVDVTLIDDGEVPLAPLPKTGQTSMRTTLTMMLSGIFVAVTALSKKRKEEDS